MMELQEPSLQPLSIFSEIKLGWRTQCGEQMKSRLNEYCGHEHNHVKDSDASDPRDGNVDSVCNKLWNTTSSSGWLP